MPATFDDLFARLDALGIETTTVRHPPLHTVEQSREQRGAIPGAHTKNLFLKNKKGRLWLVVAVESTGVDLKGLSKHVGGGRFSFASAGTMVEMLGVTPGSVTPFGLMNDTGHAVTLILDANLMHHDPLNFHPLTNEATTTIARDGFLRFLADTGHDPIVRALEPQAFAAAP